MEQLEQKEATAGSFDSSEEKEGKRQNHGKTDITYLSSGGVTTNSFKITQPSPFVEVIDPLIPVFNAKPKKTSGGRGRKKEAEEGKKKQEDKLNLPLHCPPTVLKPPDRVRLWKR